MNTNKEITPAIEDYMANATGHLVLISTIPEIDLIRNMMVNDQKKKALKLQEEIKKFKAEAESEIEAFLALSAEQYGAKLGGKKGNLSLRNYDGTAQIKIQKPDIHAYNERLQFAKVLIDECIIEESKDASELIRAVVLSVFNTEKEGKVNKTEIQRLTKLKGIKHPKWPMAMKALAESIEIIGAREYLNIYQRDEHGKMKQIILNIAGL